MKTIEHWNGAHWIGGAGMSDVDAHAFRRPLDVAAVSFVGSTPIASYVPKPIAERTFAYLNANGPGQGGAA